MREIGIHHIGKSKFENHISTENFNKEKSSSYRQHPSHSFSSQHLASERAGASSFHLSNKAFSVSFFQIPSVGIFPVERSERCIQGERFGLWPWCFYPHIQMILSGVLVQGGCFRILQNQLEDMVAAVVLFTRTPWGRGRRYCFCT